MQPNCYCDIQEYIVALAIKYFIFYQYVTEGYLPKTF